MKINLGIIYQINVTSTQKNKDFHIAPTKHQSYLVPVTTDWYQILNDANLNFMYMHTHAARA